MPRPLSSAPEAADRPSGLRRPRRRTRRWPRFLLWGGAVCLFGACAAALLAAPLVVLVVCAFVLVVALFWRSRSRRSEGFGLVPIAFVWTALAALVLALGATAAQMVVPGAGPQQSREAPIRSDVGAPIGSATPSATASPSVATVVTPRPTAAATAPPSSAVRASAAPPLQIIEAPAPAASVAVSPAPVPVPPVQVSAPPPQPPVPTATPSPTRCSPSLPLGLLPGKNCNG